jgi:hypothetical protein
VTPIDPLAVAALVARSLDDLGIRYVIGGSVASSLFGEPRSTLDLDLMIDAGEQDVRRLTDALADDYYVDAADAIEAVHRVSSFNAIHLDSSMKVDFFVADTLGKQQIARRRAITIRPDLPALYFYCAEDLVIRKLLWFRAGGESSARQWRDVVSVLKASAHTLDRAALLASAGEQDLTDLLLRAATEAGTSLGSELPIDR